jgi:hypothetical protein
VILPILLLQGGEESSTGLIWWILIFFGLPALGRLLNWVIGKFSGGNVGEAAERPRASARSETPDPDGELEIGKEEEPAFLREPSDPSPALRLVPPPAPLRAAAMPPPAPKPRPEVHTTVGARLTEGRQPSRAADREMEGLPEFSAGLPSGFGDLPSLSTLEPFPTLYPSPGVSRRAPAREDASLGGTTRLPRDRGEWRRAILWSEILAAPVALRDPGDPRSPAGID